MAVNGVNGVNNQSSLPAGEGRGEGLHPQGQIPDNNINSENQLSQNLHPQNLPPQQNSPKQDLPLDMDTILNLVKLVYQYAIETGGKTTELDKLVEQMESLLEEK